VGAFVAAGGGRTVCAGNRAQRVAMQLFGGENFGDKMMEGMMEAGMESATGMNKTDVEFMEKRLSSGEFSFSDFLLCTKAMDKVAGNEAMMKAMSLEQAAEKMKDWETIVTAMDDKQRSSPDTFSEAGSAEGPVAIKLAKKAGVELEQVGQLVNSFRMMKNFFVGRQQGKDGDVLAEEMQLETKVSQGKTRIEKRNAKQKLARSKRKTGGAGEPEWMKL